MLAHWDLYEKAGVLHRDIKPANILIVPREESSNPRGILIDFDHAIRIDDQSPYSEEKRIV
ncbi:MAG TPA: hypothetical protein VGO47_10915 [Chlamydiales bacterium]|nr:hypothetical protein [Chlamydiales bacterium]